MNYTIYSNTNITIGSQDFNTTPINLVNISCLESTYYSTIYEKCMLGELKIKKNGIDLENPVPVISRLITLHESGKISDDVLLMSDWNIGLFYLGDSELEEIESGYQKRMNDGLLYYRKKRASLVKEINNGTKTYQEVFLIDMKIKNAKDCFLTGDWQTGRAYLSLETVEGAFTLEFKNQLLSEIDSYILNNY